MCRVDQDSKLFQKSSELVCVCWMCPQHFICIFWLKQNGILLKSESVNLYSTHNCVINGSRTICRTVCLCECVGLCGARALVWPQKFVCGRIYATVKFVEIVHFAPTTGAYELRQNTAIILADLTHAGEKQTIWMWMRQLMLIDVDSLPHDENVFESFRQFSISRLCLWRFQLLGMTSGNRNDTISQPFPVILSENVIEFVCFGFVHFESNVKFEYDLRSGMSTKRNCQTTEETQSWSCPPNQFEWTESNKYIFSDRCRFRFESDAAVLESTGSCYSHRHRVLRAEKETHITAAVCLLPIQSFSVSSFSSIPPQRRFHSILNKQWDFKWTAQLIKSGNEHWTLHLEWNEICLCFFFVECTYKAENLSLRQRIK